MGGRWGDTGDAAELNGVSWDPPPNPPPPLKYGDFINSEIISQQMKCRALVCAPGFKGCCEEQQLFRETRCVREMGWWQSSEKWDF